MRKREREMIDYFVLINQINQEKNFLLRVIYLFYEQNLMHA
jgi:hypothetical protein